MTLNEIRAELAYRVRTVGSAFDGRAMDLEAERDRRMAFVTIFREAAQRIGQQRRMEQYHRDTQWAARVHAHTHGRARLKIVDP